MFYEKSNITDKYHYINITYDELLHKSDEEVDIWIDELREHIITQWDEENQPPVIGQNRGDIIHNWSKLFGYDVNDFFNTKTKVIKNFNKFASGVNQFFPTMLKTKISMGVSSDNATSIYDHFKEDDLRDKFKKAMLRGLYKDSMYSFGKSVKIKEMGVQTREFIEYFNNNEKQGIVIMRMNDSVPVSSSDTKYLVLSSSEVIELKNKKIITEQNLRTLDKIENSYTLKNGDIRYNWYWIRLYNRQQKIFPTALQIFRLGLGQPAVNFPALTAKFLYEHFTEHIKDNDITVYDPSAGWGGRILGAMSTDRVLHYIGTDPNPDNVGRYENVAEFYNTHCFQSNPFWGRENPNTYSVFAEGSEIIGNNKEFKTYKGKLDFVFTSPPYFNREQYSQDESQSFKKFSKYDDWRKNFLKPTLTTAYEWLRDDRFICWNIADIKIGDNKYIPLEQDSIDIIESLGGKYIETYKMLMTRMIGIDVSSVKNSVKVGEDYFKFEPILVFYKG